MSLKTTEFYLRYLVIAHRKKEGTKHYSQILEKELLNTIDSKVEDSYSKEYIFTPDIEQLEKRMSQVLKARKEYFSVAIKFRPTGFHLYDEKKGFNTRLLDFDQLPSLNPAVVSMLDLYKSKNYVPPKKARRIPTEGFFRKKKPKTSVI